MLKLDDFFHLPELAILLERLLHEQLTAIILSHAHESAGALCSATFADLAAYQGTAEQYDDMTMLVMAIQ